MWAGSSGTAGEVVSPEAGGGPRSPRVRRGSRPRGAGGNGPAPSRMQLRSVEIVGGSQKGHSASVAVNASQLGERQWGEAGCRGGGAQLSPAPLGRVDTKGVRCWAGAEPAEPAAPQRAVQSLALGPCWNFVSVRPEAQHHPEHSQWRAAAPRQREARPAEAALGGCVCGVGAMAEAPCLGWGKRTGGPAGRYWGVCL